jgi:type IV pilus assembly protein PilB
MDENLEEPIVKFVNEMLHDALQRSASDIHIECLANQCRIRFRIDGLLYEMHHISHTDALRMIGRLKILAKLDIAEKRLPQDGHFHFIGVDIRMNSCPTYFGEKIVLRILDSSKISLEISSLGLLETQQTLLLEKISQSQGLILVTGPTGSGKTVTLYSALQYRNKAEINIATVEDPIEIQLKGVNQVNIQPKIGLDFPHVLRALLRQDPDIIMIGEIRDAETAQIAIQAAETGHLVFATLHTNSARDAFTRFQALGISSYQLLRALSLIVSQRLVRKLCAYCKIPVKNSPFYDASSCKECLQGYSGRIGIYECLPITEQLSEILLQGTQPVLTDTLKNAAEHRLLEGLTSQAEINRILC